MPVVIECTPGYVSYIDEALHLEGPQTAVNAFPEGFDAPIDYVEFAAEQMAVYAANITPLGGTQYLFTGTGLAIVYLRAQDLFRRVMLSVPLFTVFTANEPPPADLRFFGWVISGEADNPTRVGRNLTVDLALDLRLLGLGDELTAFSAVVNYTCSAPPPPSIPTQCRRILRSSYTAKGTLYSRSRIESMPVESGAATPPYTITNLQPLDTAPIVIRHSPYYGSTVFRVAYPVSFTLQGENGVTVPQLSVVVNEYVVDGITIPADSAYIFDVRVQQIETSLVVADFAYVARLVAAGTISVIADASADALTTSLVQCDEPTINTFEDDTPPIPD